MRSDPLVSELTALFDTAGKAHHEAFASVNGEDPDWPEWYAARLIERFSELTGQAQTVESLGRRLAELEARRQREAPDAAWARYYAERIVEEIDDAEP